MSAKVSSVPLWVQETKGFPVEGFKTAAGEQDDSVVFVAHASAEYYRAGGKVGTYVRSGFAEWFLRQQQATQELVMLQPSKAMELWKAKYDARIPTGMNAELWDITHVFANVTALTARDVSGNTSAFASPRNPILGHLRAGLFKHCQRIISEDNFLNEHPFFIWRMLSILSAVCLSCNMISVVPLAFKAHMPSREDVLMMPAKLWQMASARRDIFLDGDLYDRTFPGSASQLRVNLRYLLYIFCPLMNYPVLNKHDLKVKKYEHLRRLSVFAWFTGPLDGQDETIHADLLLDTACTCWSGHRLPSGQSLGVSDEEVLEFFTEDIVSVYGAEPFLSRLRTTLEATEGRESDYLPTMLREMSRGLVHPAFRAHLETSHVMELIMHVFRKMLDASLLDTDDMSMHVALFPTILPFLNGLSKDAGVKDIVTLLLRKYDVMTWISAGLLSCARLDATNTTNVSEIIHTYQSMVQQLKRRKSGKADYHLLVNSLRRVWYGTLATLQQHTYPSPEPWTVPFGARRRSSGLPRSCRRHGHATSCRFRLMGALFLIPPVRTVSRFSPVPHPHPQRPARRPPKSRPPVSRHHGMARSLCSARFVGGRQQPCPVRVRNLIAALVA
ncbi:hypothetical protein PENSPDRAFT_370674 [Peniophora sp. CONT]|nr:hypothetical protein PENSPDRAFT_370674 [Peniophora sp. CONT]